MSHVVLNKICKSYDNNVLTVKDFSLDINKKEFIVFVGPSGCGKSTVLRMIAGLEEITSGELWIDGRLMNYTEPGERDVAMVFQNYALYPNMNIYDNLAFSLSIRKMPKEEIKERVEYTAKILGIDMLLDRKPSELSGGQRQRVAIGSAILRSPKIFLMDEPLSNLDAKMRTQMRAEIARLYEKVDSIFIYVTHDQTEAMALGTRIVVLNAGEIQQVDSPQRLYDHPKNKFIAGFIGSPSMNFIKADISDDGKLLSVCGGRERIVPLDWQQLFINRAGKNSTRAIIGIRPSNICLASMAEGDRYSKPFSVKAVLVEYLGSECLIHFNMAGEKCIASVPASANVKENDTVELCIDRDRMHLFDIDSEDNIFELGD